MLPEDQNTLPLPAEADAAVAGAASAMAVSSGKKLVNLTVLP